MSSVQYSGGSSLSKDVTKWLEKNADPSSKAMFTPDIFTSDWALFNWGQFPKAST